MSETAPPLTEDGGQRALLIMMRDDAAANGDFQGAAELDAALDELDHRQETMP